MAGGPDQKKGGSGAVWVNLGAWALAIVLMVGAASLGSWLILRSTPPLRAFADAAEPVRAALKEPVPREQGPLIDNPAWAVRPTPYYPPRAAMAGVAGRVVLLCGIRESGRIGDCEVRSEEPQGHGFGQAAKKGLRNARLSAATMEGAAEDAQIELPFTWRLE